MIDEPTLVKKENQRIAKRRPLRSSGALLVTGGNGPILFNAVDITTDGIGIMPSVQLTAGQRCRVKFDLPVRGHALDVFAVARISYCILGRDGFKAGLQFEEMDEAGKTAIANYIQW